MSDQHKPKIDLKARLGKARASTPPSSPSQVPPPKTVPSSIPAPPQGMVTSIPAPPFRSVSMLAPPPVSSNSPFAKPEQFAPQFAAPPPAPAAIKVEVGEEVVEARAKDRKKAMVLAAFTAAVGIVIGFGVGNLYTNREGAEVALVGARALLDEVDKANVEVTALAEVLKEAGKKIGDGTFPKAEVSRLAEIRIPFDGTNLAGKGIGRFDKALLTQLIAYASVVETANDQKDKIRRLLAGAETGITELLGEREAPKVRWSVVVGSGPSGPMASMLRVPEPFLIADKEKKDYAWPEELKITQGQRETKFTRYQKGGPAAEEFIPVDPGTQNDVCPNDTIQRIAVEVSKMRGILEGDRTPGHETPGVVELGETILSQLRKIGGPG